MLFDYVNILDCYENSKRAIVISSTVDSINRYNNRRPLTELHPTIDIDTDV